MVILSNTSLHYRGFLYTMLNMVSLIVCSRRDPADTLHQRNAEKTTSGPIDYIRIDNRERNSGICSVYNSAVAQAKGDILAFMHEDAFFMEKGWNTVLEKKFTDPSVG